MDRKTFLEIKLAAKQKARLVIEAHRMNMQPVQPQQQQAAQQQQGSGAQQLPQVQPAEDTYDTQSGSQQPTSGL